MTDIGRRSDCEVDVAKQWYYAQDGRKTGPVDSKALRAMAASGALGPDDLIWAEGSELGRQARSVKGLFAADGEVASTLAAKPTEGIEAIDPPIGGLLTSDPAKSGSDVEPTNVAEELLPPRRRVWERAWFVLPFVMILYPLGLPLIWVNRTWSRRAKLCWTVGGAAFFGLVLLSPRDESNPVDDETTATQPVAVSNSVMPIEGAVGLTPSSVAPDDGRPTEEELVQLLAMSVAGTVAQSDSWQSVNPEGFNRLMQLAARELGAGNSPETRGLLQIEPTATGVKNELLQVRYGPRRARVCAMFRPGSRVLIGVMIQGKTYTPVGIIQDK